MSKPTTPTNQQPSILTRLTAEEFAHLQAFRAAQSMSASEIILADPEDISILKLIGQKAYNYYLAGVAASKEAIPAD